MPAKSGAFMGVACKGVFDPLRFDWLDDLCASGLP